MIQTHTQSGGTVTFDASDWKAGLGPGGRFASTTGKKHTTNGFQTMTSVDPFSLYGAISPGWAASSAATNASSLAGTVMAFQTKDNTIVYGVDAGGKVHSIDYSTNTINASPHTITGTSPVGQDMVFYRRRTAATPTYTTSAFYSYYNNTNWDVGVIPDVTTFGSFSDTFMSGVGLDITSSATVDGKSVEQRTMPHPLCIGADDILYIGSGRYLHAYDGDTGTAGAFTSRVLTLPAGSQIVGMRKYNDVLLIACNYYSTGSTTGVGEALVYVWNYRDADTSQTIPLEDNYVSAIFIWKGTPTVVTSGLLESSGTIKVKELSGSTVTKVADFDGTLPVMRGIVVGNEIIYMNCGGKIVSVGDRHSARTYPVNHLGTLGSAGTSGGLFYDAASSSSLFLIGSSGTGGTYSFNSITATNGYGAGNCRSYAVYPKAQVGKVCRITAVSVEYAGALAASGTNGSYQLVLYADNANSTNIIVDGLASVAYPLTKRYTVTTAQISLPACSSFEILQQWATASGGGSPLISSITVEYIYEDVINA